MDDFGMHRSVHPAFLEEGEVSMQAFSPTSEENYDLSVDCEKIWLAPLSYEFRTLVLGRSSAGIWTVSRELFTKLGLEIKADSKPNNPAHSLVQFPKKDKGRRRDAARRLAGYANNGSLSRIAKS